MDKISIINSDITTLSVDAIVNAANGTLLGGGGVDGAIHKAAGPGLLQECRTLNGCDTGDAKITSGYQLPAKYVVHTVGPRNKDPVLLENCYKSCLRLVLENNIKSIAFCSISTGVYGFPKQDASHVALRTIQNWLVKNHDKIDHIIICTFSDEDSKMYHETLRYYFPSLGKIMQDELQNETSYPGSSKSKSGWNFIPLESSSEEEGFKGSKKLDTVFDDMIAAAEAQGNKLKNRKKRKACVKPQLKIKATKNSDKQSKMSTKASQTKRKINYARTLDIASNEELYYQLSRGDCTNLNTPKIMRIQTIEYISIGNNVISNYYELQHIAPKSDCITILETFEKNPRFNAVKIDGMILFKKDVQSIIKLHNISCIKNKMLLEIDWIGSEVVATPDDLHSVKEDFLEDFKGVLYAGRDHVCHKIIRPTLLISDLALLTCHGWFNLQLIQTFIAQINNTQVDYKTISLSALFEYQSNDRLAVMISNWKRNGVTRFSIIANVAMNKNNQTFAADQFTRGNHWSCFYIDIKKCKFIYSDSLGWPIPKNLSNKLGKFLKNVEDIYKTTLQISDIQFGHHFNGNSARHQCSDRCIQGFPAQNENYNICGAAAIFSAIIFSNQSIADAVICSQKLPEQLHWMGSLDKYNDYSRKVLITWYMKDKMDLNDIGINEEKDSSSLKENYTMLIKNEQRNDVDGNDDNAVNFDDKKEGQIRLNSVEKLISMLSQKNETDESDDDAEDGGEITDVKKESSSEESKNENKYPQVDGDLNGNTNVAKERSSEKINDDENKNPRVDSDLNEKTDVVKNASIFKVGQRFNNIDDVYTAQELYEEKNYCQLIKKDSRTLEAAKKRVPKRVDNANQNLVYYYLQLTCKFGGKPSKRDDRVRNTKSFRQGCPHEIYFSLSKDGQALQVERVNEVHNHIIAKELYHHLPRQRALPEAILNEVKAAIKLKANTKLIQQKLETSLGKKTTLKDIQNIRQKTTRDISKNDIESIVAYLKGKGDCTVEVFIDEEDNFKGLLYQDSYMQSIYEKYPEILLVDATYKLLELRMPVYLLLAIDGNGLSEAVCMFFIAEETKAVVTCAVEKFKQHNEQWDQTNVIMSDKDFNEREAFTSCFPNASLQICLYHTLRSFRREIVCEKMGITSAQKTRCLEIIQSIAYSKDEEEYKKNVKLLVNTKIVSVVDYFKENWDNIKEQWVSCFKESSFNLGETTNNRLESMFNKIKSVCSKYASLMQFFNEFFAVLGALRNERNHQYLMALSKQSIKKLTQHKNDYYGQYADLATPYAFKFIEQQSSAASFVTCPVSSSQSDEIYSVGKYETTAQSCNCSFITKMGLPCRHIFKLRSFLRMPLYDSSLVHKRWTINYYKSMTNGRFGIENRDADIGVDVMVKEKGKLSQAQKFRKLMTTCQLIASVASEGGMKTFDRRFEQLQYLLSQWQLGNEVEFFIHNPIEDDDGFEDNVEEQNQMMKETSRKKVEKVVLEKCEVKMENAEEIGENTNNVDEKVRKQEQAKFDIDDTIQLEDDEFKENEDKIGERIKLMKENNVREVEKDVLECKEKIKNAEENGGDENEVEEKLVERNQEQAEEDVINKIKMPPKIKKRGRPKGAETTVVGLPRKKARKNGIAPFSKLDPLDKDRIILHCLTNKVAANEAIKGERLLQKDDLISALAIPDTIRDEMNIDVHRVEKYFDGKGWNLVLKNVTRKQKCKWTCLVCSKVVGKDDGEESLMCERCLLWCHLKCTKLSKLPKKKHWFCTPCVTKYSQS